jgi:hypothetical protein
MKSKAIRLDKGRRARPIGITRDEEIFDEWRVLTRQILDELYRRRDDFDDLKRPSLGMWQKKNIEHGAKSCPYNGCVVDR